MDKLNNMDDMYKLSKDRITTDMFTEFSEIKENGVVSDFQIKVESEVFNVHRFILIAASPYFKALFKSDMREVELKFIEMVGLKADGIKYCLQFIYTRDIDLSKAPIESIWPASHLLQIDALTDLCFGYLRLNISKDKCISTLKLSQLYRNNVVMNTADQYILKHFKDIILTDDFLSLNQDDLTRYLEKSTEDYASSWKAVVRWLDNNNKDIEQVLLQLMKTMKIENFPFEFLLKTVMSEPLVERHQKARNQVINLLFSNPDQVKQNLTLETVFPLRKLAKRNKIPNAEDVLKFIHEFIGDNFASLAQKEDIRGLDEKEIVQLLESQNSYFDEKAKFIAAVNWAGTDRERGKKYFPKLFKLINLERLSSDFIKQNVRSVSLVKKSRECLDHILDCYEKDPVPHIACLYEDSNEVKIFNPSSNQWSLLVKVPESNNKDIVSVGNMLYLLAGKTLSVLQKDGTWLKKTSMLHHPECVVSFQDRIYGIDKDTMACYDPIQNTWNTNLPGCGLDFDFCVANSDEFIYAIGGSGTDDEAKKFDLNTKTWSKITSMNIGRFGASAAFLNGKVFVMGGWGYIDDEHDFHEDDDDYDDDDDVHDKPLHNVEYFDPTQQRWYNATGLCHPRVYFSSCVVNNKLYAVGGGRDADNKPLDPDSIEVYNQEIKIVSEMRNSKLAVRSCVIGL